MRPPRLCALAFFFLLLPGNTDAQCPDVPVIHTGEATFYTFASGGGACLFDPTPNDLMVGAMNQVDYGNSQVCGECVSVVGPNGTILIRIVDMCPGCQQGDIDLSPLAFSRIADTSRGRVPITWQVVPCAVSGPIEYHFKDGSNQWWTAVQIRNHRHPILSLEYINSQNTYTLVNRVEYNYFVETTGMGPGPYTFRVTDVYGHQVVDTGIAPVENGSVPGHAQLPQCAAVSSVGEKRVPESVVLGQNYPNPFNPSTTFQFTIVDRQLSIVKVYDLLGHDVATLVNEVKQPGTYTVQFDAKGLTSGVYFYRLQTGSFVQTRTLVLIR